MTPTPRSSLTDTVLSKYGRGGVVATPVALLGTTPSDYKSYDELHCSHHLEERVGAPLRAYASARSRRKETGGGFFYEDEAEHRIYGEIALHLRAELKRAESHYAAPVIPSAWRRYDSAYRDALLAGTREVELDNAGKAGGYWRYHPSGSELFTAPLVVPDVPFDEGMMKAEFLLLLRFLATRADGARVAAGRRQFISVRIDSHGGWPTYAPGEAVTEKMALLDVSIGQGRSFQAAVDRARSLTRSIHGGKLGSDPRIVRFTRVQGSRSGWPAAANEVTRARLRIWQDERSMKHRAVFAVGLLANSFLFGTQRALFSLLHQWEMFPDTVDAAVEYLANLSDAGLSVIPEDISGFDLSIPPSQLRALVAALVEYGPTLATNVPTMSQWEVANMAAALQAVITWPVVCSASTGGSGDVQQYEREGGQPSGNQLTSPLGSLLNVHRLVSKRAFLRGTTFQAQLTALANKEWGFVVQSDDTDLALPPGEVAEWESLSWMDYKTTTQGWPVYLQRVLDLRGRTHYGIATRFWDSSVNKEAMSEPHRIPVVDLGISVRRSLLEGSPFAHVYERLMGSAPKTGQALDRSAKHTLLWHETEVASMMRARPTAADVASLMGFYGHQDPSGAWYKTITGRQLANVLGEYGTMPLGALVNACQAVGEERLSQEAGRRLRIHR